MEQYHPHYIELFLEPVILLMYVCWSISLKAGPIVWNLMSWGLEACCCFPGAVGAAETLNPGLEKHRLTAVFFQGEGPDKTDAHFFLCLTNDQSPDYVVLCKKS